MRQIIVFCVFLFLGSIPVTLLHAAGNHEYTSGQRRDAPSRWEEKRKQAEKKRKQQQQAAAEKRRKILSEMRERRESERRDSVRRLERRY